MDLTDRDVAPVPPIGHHLRRDAAVVLDLAVAVLSGGAGLLAGLLMPGDPASAAASTFRLAVLALAGMAVGSFVNQVPLTLATRASIGKHVMALCVVRVDTVGRPGFWQATHRWSYGVVFMLAVLPLAVLGMDIGGPKRTQIDAMGLRITRRACFRLREQCPGCRSGVHLTSSWGRRR